MDLWVKNQSKNGLYKVDNVIVDNVTNAIVTRLGDEDEWLGFYESKERTLEVLDEIQKLLIGDVLYFKNVVPPDFEELKSIGVDKAIVYNMRKDDRKQIEFLHRDCVVFEMPEK